MAKERLDILLAHRGLADSREKAQRLIRAGQVLAGGQAASKPGHKFDEHIPLELKAQPRFVGRGGDKLEAAFEAFDLNVAGLICLDIGASTGGFTDCLLQHEASKVYAVDVGKGQLAWKLRNDPRVMIIDGVNARYLKEDDLPEKPQFAVMDVSFISLTKIMSAIVPILGLSAHMVTLIKPQFEAGRTQVKKGGVVRDPTVHAAVIKKIKSFGTSELGLEWLDMCESPRKGPAKNVEFLAHWRKVGKTEEF